MGAEAEVETELNDDLFKNAEAANADSSTTPGENEANADVQKSNGALTPAAETTGKLLIALIST